MILWFLDENYDNEIPKRKLKFKKIKIHISKKIKNFSWRF